LFKDKQKFLVSYIAALEKPGPEVAPVSSHDTLDEAKKEFAEKKTQAISASL